jgi:DNA-binding transcriptional MerR regulator
MSYRYRFRRPRSAPRKKARFRVEGMTAAELGARVGVSARTVKYYASQGVLPAAVFRGAATRYGHQHLLCLAAIRWLQRERRMSLQAIRLNWSKVSQAELERMAGAFLPELARSAAAATVPPSAEPSNQATLQVSDTWQRFTVVPGLELHLHSSASAEVQRLARELSQNLLLRPAS